MKALSKPLVTVLLVISLIACGSSEDGLSDLPPELAQGDPIETPFDTRPSALNRDEFQAALQENTPEDLEIRPGSDTAMVFVLIDTEGQVRRTVVSGSSGQPELDAAAKEVASVIRFSPGLRDGEPVHVWLELPIIFGL